MIIILEECILKMKAINICPHCSANGRDADPLDCGERVKRCNGCGKLIMYYEVYKPYDKKEVSENPKHYNLK